KCFCSFWVKVFGVLSMHLLCSYHDSPCLWKSLGCFWACCWRPCTVPLPISCWSGSTRWCWPPVSVVSHCRKFQNQRLFGTSTSASESLSWLFRCCGSISSRARVAEPLRGSCCEHLGLLPTESKVVVRGSSCGT